MHKYAVSCILIQTGYGVTLLFKKDLSGRAAHHARGNKIKIGLKFPLEGHETLFSQQDTDPAIRAKTGAEMSALA